MSSAWHVNYDKDSDVEGGLVMEAAFGRGGCPVPLRCDYLTYKTNHNALGNHSPEMANRILLLAPKVVMPSSFRSLSVKVRKVERSI